MPGASLARRPSNPFTRNQDERDNSLDAASPSSPQLGQSPSVSGLLRRMRNASIGSQHSDTIDEEDDQDEDALPPMRTPGMGADYHLGSAEGVGSGVFEPAAHAAAAGQQVPSGLTFKPTLQPAGGAARHVTVDGVPDPNQAYDGPPDAEALAGGSSTHRNHSADAHRFTGRRRGVVRTYSMAQQKGRPPIMNDDRVIRQRRLSHDNIHDAPRRFIVDVEETMRLILEQEDTDGNFQISITDSGPKVLSLGTATSNGYRSFDIRGTYMLSNLLQELALAREHGRKRIMLDESRLTENPVDRLSRMISQTFWHNLTRRIDGDGLDAILNDPKNRSKSRNPRIYVPHGEDEMLAYYKKVAEERPALNIQVEGLPKSITPDFTRDLNDRPGLLALAMKKVKSKQGGEDIEVLKGIPFIVPGARFNELYNWDSVSV